MSAAERSLSDLAELEAADAAVIPRIGRPTINREAEAKEGERGAPHADVHGEAAAVEEGGAAERIVLEDLAVQLRRRVALVRPFADGNT